MFEVEVAVDKPVIRELGALNGFGNGDTVNVAGKIYKPGTLIFVGFVSPGKDPLDGLWHGVLRFDEGETPEYQRKGMRKLIPDDLQEVPPDLPVAAAATEADPSPPETEINDDVDNSD